jgi:hypothetical protein
MSAGLVDIQKLIRDIALTLSVDQWVTGQTGEDLNRARWESVIDIFQAIANNEDAITGIIEEQSKSLKALSAEVENMEMQVKHLLRGDEGFPGEKKVR